MRKSVAETLSENLRYHKKNTNIVDCKFVRYTAIQSRFSIRSALLDSFPRISAYTYFYPAILVQLNITKTIFQYDSNDLNKCYLILDSCNMPMTSSGLKNIRLSNRFPYKTVAPYTIGSKQGMGSVINLSQDGMLFTTNDALNVGEKINIDFQFRHGRHRMNLNGRIVRIAKNGVGVKFLWL